MWIRVSEKSRIHNTDLFTYYILLAYTLYNYCKISLGRVFLVHCTVTLRSSSINYFLQGIQKHTAMFKWSPCVLFQIIFALV